MAQGERQRRQAVETLVSRDLAGNRGLGNTLLAAQQREREMGIGKKRDRKRKDSPPHKKRRF